MSPIKILSCLLLYVMLSGVTMVICQTGLSSSEKQEILDAHNRLRGMVSPTASNMERMVWNDELAEVAQDYAERCVFEHNPNRVAQQNTFSSVGENLAAGTGDADYVGFVQSWYNEVEDYTFETNTCNSERVCGHYTQVVWATSRHLGCGAFRCSNLQNFRPDSIYLVCNYGPAGNFRGQHPYASGASCSNCASDAQFCVGNTCSSTQTMERDSTDDGFSVMWSSGSLLLVTIISALSSVMNI